jgi:hypothetical protein
MELHEAEARWLESRPVPGVLFQLNEPVEVRGGVHAGQMGSAIGLLALAPEPLYLIELEPEGHDIQALQSQLGSV